jgi:YidC/Oxa1 family membrane protein insertase
VNPLDIFLPIWNPLLSAIEAGLQGLAALTGSGGLAIILFTIGLKLVLVPLSLMQTRSMKAMQAIQPELAELRKKHGKDREAMAREQMRLYKEHGVNPAAGCLPMLPMMIILIALYQALINLSCDPNLAGNTCDPERSDPRFRESWLWISNLGLPDIPFTLPGEIPIPGILPVVMLITQFMYGKMTPSMGAADDPQQQMMQRMTVYFMPIMLFFFSFNFPAGLVLYWVVSNIFEIVRMGVTVSWEPLRPAVLLPSVFGGTTAAARLDDGRRSDNRSDGGRAPKSASTERNTPSTDGVNPTPGRPPGGSRKKKGKRGGKR